AGLIDKKRGPKEPPRKVWLPRMVQVYHLQKAHPDAGEFRIWSLLAQPDISARTVGRIMALHKLVYDDIPHVPQRGHKPPPQPHPYKAQYRVVYLSPADKYHRLTRRLPQGQKGLKERAIMASQRPSPPW